MYDSKVFSIESVLIFLFNLTQYFLMKFIYCIFWVLSLKLCVHDAGNRFLADGERVDQSLFWNNSINVIGQFSLRPFEISDQFLT